MKKNTMDRDSLSASALRASSILILLTLVSACKDMSPSSRIKIDSGEFIHQGSTNKVEGVFYSFTKRVGASSGGACTGTAVSTTTAITAAHCVLDGGDRIDKETGKVSGKQYCITNSLYKDVCSSEIYARPEYPQLESSGGRGTDLAWVVFPEGTFKYIFPVNAEPLQIGDEVILVGYSEAKMPDKSKGSKRFGWNRVSSFASSARSDIFSNYSSRFEGVAVSPGDSGGPLMKECKVSGIASRMTEESNKKSIHTNVTNPDNAATLKASSAAYFCGLTGNDPRFCPPDAMYVRKSGITSASKEFPCVVPSLDQSANNNAGPVDPPQPQPQPQPAPQPPLQPNPQPAPSSRPFKIFAALTEANELLIRGEETITSASVCVGQSKSAAESCSSRINATWDGRQFKAKPLLSNNQGSEIYIKIEARRQRDGALSTQTIKVRRK